MPKKRTNQSGRKYMSKKTLRNGLIFGLMGMFIGVGADARAARDQTLFPPAQTIGSHQLELKGTGTIHYLGIFRVSKAGFYLPPATSPDAALSDIHRRLELTYFYDIDREDFITSTRYWIRKNVSEVEYEALAPRIAAFNALYEDVRKGDRYGLTYQPGIGTTLDLNGVVKGTVPGADFAAALFSIWIGPEPLTRRLRAALLGHDE
jgi:hypothetical protein